MARMTKEQKRIEAEFDRCFKLHGQNVQFDIMDLGKLHAEATANPNIEEGTKAAIAKYRKN